MTRIGTSITLAAALSMAAFTPSPVQAETLTMAIAPAELTSGAGLEALYSRIQRRARAACETMSDLHQLSDRNACRDELVTGIVERVGHTGLSALDGGTEVRMAAAESGDEERVR